MTEASSARPRPIETLAGFLAAAAIAVSLLGIPYHPVKLCLPAIVVAFACVIIGGKFQKLAMWAVWIGATSWFAGMIAAVVTKHALW